MKNIYLATALVFLSSIGTSFLFGMEGQDFSGGESFNLEDARAVQEMRRRVHQEGVSQLGHANTGDLYLVRRERERAFIEKMKLVILLIRKFFAIPGREVNFQQAILLINKLVDEIEQAEFDLAKYVVKEFQYKIFPSLTTRQQALQDEMQPEHTILYYLVRLSAQYEQQGLSLRAKLGGILLGIIFSTYLGVTKAPFSTPLIVWIAVIYFWEYLYSMSHQEAESNITTINDLATTIYEKVSERMDDETKALIQDLCNQNPRPRIINELFSDFCLEEKGGSA